VIKGGRRTMKRDMELELGPRISNFGKGIEQIGIEKYLWERKRSVITSNEDIINYCPLHNKASKTVPKLSIQK
jgi:hypothetical protein